MSPDASPLLAVKGLVKRFGGFRALDELNFDLKPGEILGLVGPNGSGKTTFINVISGLYRPEAGEVYFEGQPIAGLPSHRLVHLGINRTFQVPKPFLTLSVRQNVEIAIAYGSHPQGPGDANALLVVEHLMGFIDQITDRVIVMNAGKEIFEGVLADAVKNPRVVEIFIGGEDAA